MTSELDRLIATLEAWDQQLDSLTLQEAYEELGAIIRVHGGMFEKVTIALGCYDLKEKKWNDGPTTELFKRALKKLIDYVAQPLADEVAHAKQTGKNLGKIYVDQYIDRRALKLLHTDVKATITILQEIGRL